MTTDKSCADALTDRDYDLHEHEQGLYRKFDVRRVDGSSEPGGKHHDCEHFVLDMMHDQHARAALRAYADACASTHPELSVDLIARYGLSPVEQHEAAPAEALTDHMFGMFLRAIPKRLSDDEGDRDALRKACESLLSAVAQPEPPAADERARERAAFDAMEHQILLGYDESGDAVFGTDPKALAEYHAARASSPNAAGAEGVADHD
ncbi:hypothetical protein BOC40_11660 [Burkholderia pseudomallei]|uniref:hypothetical protein n=1 Tax=Burkholderia pseudomallei TaxID=28450 RepID=UPI000A1A19CE|nr:hypothetical protein [Burkholderia pseudomallei]ARK80981.1 hypothetical protein BOC40_11660 [Burkholderia pseudomallei]ARL45437.1 hypothetical protein BOC50_20220 [Burkholderia pseudomallei]